MQDRKCCPDKNFLSGTKQNVVGAFDQIASHGDYDGLYTSSRCQAEDRLLGFYLDTLIPAGGRVLDVGCGTGLFLRVTSVRRAYTGLDISPVMLERASNRHPSAEFIQGDVEKIPFSDNTFDAVVALYGTCSYWPDPVRALHEIHRVLKPRGILWLMPNTLRWFRKGIRVMGEVNVLTAPAPWVPWQTEQRLNITGFDTLRLRGFSVTPRIAPLEAMLGYLSPTMGRYMIVYARNTWT